MLTTMDFDGAGLEVDLGSARLDLDRAARTGDPEVVFGVGKTPTTLSGHCVAWRRRTQTGRYWPRG